MTVKLYNLKPWEIEHLKRVLHYYYNNGIKITFLKRVIFIHCVKDKPYQGLLNIMHGYVHTNRISYNEKTAKWLQQYYPFRNNPISVSE